MLYKRIRPLLLALLMAVMLLPAQAMALDAIDTTQKTSLTVQVSPDGKPQKDVEFRLYRVAEVSPHCYFTLSGAFKEYPVDLRDNDSDDWRALATTLSGYVRTDALSPDAAAKTNETGSVTFVDLPTGLYLLLADRWYDTSTHYYTPAPILISLPNLNTEEQWIYGVTISAKLTPGWDSPTPTYTELSVLKLWNDNNSEKRPTEIQVELYNDSVLTDTVTLSKANNWQHTWTKLDSKANWFVREKEVSEGYTVSIEQQGNRFVLTNTLPDMPDDPDDPGDPDDPKLPQTGVLWWPVPVLLAAGLFFILLGALRRRGER